MGSTSWRNAGLGVSGYCTCPIPCATLYSFFLLTNRTIPQGTLFSSFRISSALQGSEIPLDLRLEDLTQAMKSAQEFHNVSLQLIKKANASGGSRHQAYLEFVMGNDVSWRLYGSASTITNPSAAIRKLNGQS